MNSGPLIHRVDIEEPVRSVNAIGESVVTSWEPVVKGVPCRVLEQTSVEVYRARQMQADATHVVRMRWRDKMLPTWRLRWKRPDRDRLLNVIGAVNPDGRRVELVVQCREDVPET